MVKYTKSCVEIRSTIDNEPTTVKHIFSGIFWAIISVESVIWNTRATIQILQTIMGQLYLVDLKLFTLFVNVREMSCNEYK